jgi:guanine deaminase
MDDEWQILKNKQASVSHCPTSNLFLASGLFRLDKARQYEVPVGLGTDIGAGTSFSQFRTMDEAYKVSQLLQIQGRMNGEVCEDHGIPFSNPIPCSGCCNSGPGGTFNAPTPFELLYLATLGGAKALDLDNVIGNFEAGKEADFIVVDPSSSALQKLRQLKANARTTNSLFEKLFALIVTGDDRNIVQTYILGNPSLKDNYTYQFKPSNNTSCPNVSSYPPTTTIKTSACEKGKI